MISHSHTIYKREGMELQAVLWEHDSGVNEDISIIVPHKHAIHSNFTQPTNRKNTKGWPIWSFVKLLHLALNRVFHAFFRTFYSSWSFLQYFGYINIYSKHNNLNYNNTDSIYKYTAINKIRITSEIEKKMKQNKTKHHYDRFDKLLDKTIRY